MMTKEANKPRAIILQLLSLPIITILVYLLCTETIAQVTPTPKVTPANSKTNLLQKERRDTYYSGVHVLIDDQVKNILIDKPYEKLTQEEKDRYSFYVPDSDDKNTYSHYPGKTFKMTITEEYRDNLLKNIQEEEALRLKDLDKQPEFPEGSFQAYVLKNMKLPEIKEKLKTKINVSFIVENDGSVTNVEVLKNPGQGVGDAIKKAVEGSPRWKPGVKDGKPTRVAIILPITIKVKK